MKSLIVTIDGREVAIPTGEIRPLIDTLIRELAERTVSGQLDGTPREGYLTYGECEEILSVLYSGRLLRNHVGSMWGAICRLTQWQFIDYDAICTDCNTHIAAQPQSRRPCYHGSGRPYGNRRIIISVASLIENYSAMMEFKPEGTHAPKRITNQVKSDYRVVVEALHSE